MLRYALPVLFLSSGLLAQKPLCLVEYGQDLAFRDRCIREQRVYADLGRQLVARLDLSTREALQGEGKKTLALGTLRAGEQMAVVLVRATPERPAAVRILASLPRRYVVAGTKQEIAALARPGLFHGGVQVVPLSEAYSPVPETRVSLRSPLGADPRISAMVAKVSSTNLTAHIKTLSAIQTRNARRVENATAIKYLQTELKKIPGLSIKTESFSSSYGPNVIAELKGKESPNEIVMVGAHLDSYVYGGYSKRSPGADDNASGTAAVLEIARIFAATPMQRTVRFAFWNAEEFGLIGSNAYAAAAKSRGDKILAYLNTDMNAYRASGDTVDVDFVTNDSTSSLITTLTGISKLYVPKLGVKQGYLGGGTSDHRSFYRRGFPAVFYFEDLDKYSHYIHSSSDTLGLSANDMNLSTLIVQSVTAGLATLGKPLDAPSFTLSRTKGQTIGGELVNASGAGLGAATSVKVGGRSVSFQQIGANLAFRTPASSVLGSVKVEIANAAGTGAASFLYVITKPAALRVSSLVPIGGTGSFVTGGQPGHFVMSFVSPLLGTTNLGLVSLDIGKAQLGTLFLFNIATLSTKSGTLEYSLAVPKDQKLKNVKLWFQCVHLDGKLSTILKTNTASMLIQ